MLLVVDAPNLFHSAREMFGRGARIDFKKLRERIVGKRHFAVIYSLAFIPEEKRDLGNFHGALKRLGYEYMERVAGFALQIQELERLDGYTHLAVASGDGSFAPLLRFYQEAGRAVELYAFIDAINTELKQYTTVVEHLRADVLMGDFATLGKLKEAPA